MTAGVPDGCVVPRTRIRGRADAGGRTRGEHARMTISQVTTLEQLTVGDVMHPGVFTCAEDASLEVAAAMMAGHSIHCVVVLEEANEDKPWGVISDLDLVSAAFDHDAAEWKAGAAAATPAVTIGVDAPLRRAAQLMREYGIAHLVAVDPDAGTPLGIISTLDLARVIAQNREV
jgi:CBS domain-containing protein